MKTKDVVKRILFSILHSKDELTKEIEEHKETLKKREEELIADKENALKDAQV